MKTSIPKRLRFEVFKRDSFKCQYCGKAAPQVVLHCDHIKPEASGGETTLLNLITACAECNLGKGAVPLSSDAAVSRQKAQLDELQERREQLEMLMEWQEGLRDIQDDTVDRICEVFRDTFKGYALSANCQQVLRKLMRDYSAGEIISGIHAAADAYLKFDRAGQATQDSVNRAWQKLPGVLSVERTKRENPTLAEILRIRGLVKKRCEGDWRFSYTVCLEWLQAAHSWGATIEEIRSLAKSVRDWNDFYDRISDLIARCKRERRN